MNPQAVVEHDTGAARWDARLVAGADGLLGQFNTAGVLAPADLHVARTLGALCGETAPEVLLAAALAVRAPRIGHVCTDLATVALSTAVDTEAPVDLTLLPLSLIHISEPTRPY